jgi:hypothetical protein
MYGGDVHWTIDNEKRQKVPMPEDLAAEATATKKHVWGRRIEKYPKRNNQLMANLDTALSLIMGQCTTFIWA